nr:hypothetical protein [Bacteroidales bacterium]
MYDNLFNDWVGERDANTRVSRFDRHKDRFGWESERAKGRGFSSLLYNFENLDTLELIRKSYQVAKTRMNSMGIFKVGLSLTQAENSTDGKSIKVSTEVMGDTAKDESLRTDIFLGEVVHESAHVLYTDFNELIESRGKFSGSVEIYHMLWNIIEDEYIEREIGKYYPGYTNYLAAIKQYILGSRLDVEPGSVDADGADVKRELTEVGEIVNTFLQFIRYPESIDIDLVKKHELLLRKLKELFKGSYPSSTIESLLKAEQVYDLIKEYYKMPPKRKRKKDEEGSAADPGGDASSADKSKDEESKDGDGKTGEDKPKKGKRKSFERDFKEAAKKINIVLNSSLDPDKEDFGKEIDENDEVTMESMLDLEDAIDVSGKAVIIKSLPRGDAERYSEIRDRIKSAIATLSNQLIFDTFQKENVLRGLRSGKLDAAKIVEASQGIQTVYTVTREKKVKGGS